MEIKIPKIELIPKGTAERIMNNVIWGNSHFNPNKKEMDQELLDEAKRLTQHND